MFPYLFTCHSVSTYIEPLLKGELLMTIPVVPFRDDGEQARGLLQVAKYGRWANIHRGTLDKDFFEERAKRLVAPNYLNDYRSGYIGYEGGKWPDSDFYDSKSDAGKRERIYGLSRPARRRFLRLAMSLDLRRSAISLMLTYPDNFPEDPKQWQNHLNALKKCLLRHFSQMSRNAQGKREYKSEFSAFWRIEFTIRQSGEISKGQLVPHMHIVLFLNNQEPAKFPRKWLKEFWQWLSKIWNRIINNHSKEYQKARIDVKILRIRRKKSVEYFLRYIAKPDYKDKPSDFDIAEYYPMGTGRVWGVWCKENLPMSPIVELSITEEQFDLLQRYFKEEIWELVIEEIQFESLQCFLDKDFEGLKALLEQCPGSDPERTMALLAQLSD
jgi:hypothetical protein